MPANLPYPFQFDPSQWKNPYSKWAGLMLPFMSAEVGPSGLYGGTAPTDAMGNPIQSYTDAASSAAATYQQQMADYQKQLDAYNAGSAAPSTPGTTINNTGPGTGGQPASGGTINYAGMGSAGPAVQELESNFQNAQAGLTPQQQFIQQQNNAIRQQQLNQQDNITATANAGGGFGRSAGGAFNPGPSYSPLMGFGAGGGGPAAPARPAAPTPPTQPNMTGAYLAALQNPGPVTSPGANVPQAPPPSQQSNVLQQFLANWQGAGGKTTGAGNYNNKGFFDALTGNV